MEPSTYPSQVNSGIPSPSYSCTVVLVEIGLFLHLPSLLRTAALGSRGKTYAVSSRVHARSAYWEVRRLCENQAAQRCARLALCLVPVQAHQSHPSAHHTNSRTHIKERRTSNLSTLPNCLQSWLQFWTNLGAHIHRKRSSEWIWVGQLWKRSSPRFCAAADQAGGAATPRRTAFYTPVTNIPESSLRRAERRCEKIWRLLPEPRRGASSSPFWLSLKFAMGQRDGHRRTSTRGVLADPKACTRHSVWNARVCNKGQVLGQADPDRAVVHWPLAEVSAVIAWHREAAALRDSKARTHGIGRWSGCPGPVLDQTSLRRDKPFMSNFKNMGTEAKRTERAGQTKTGS